MKLKADANNEIRQKMDESNFPREMSHGRFKEDYMKLKADSREPSNAESDEPLCSPSWDLEGPTAGCVTHWSLVTYGTAQRDYPKTEFEAILQFELKFCHIYKTGNSMYTVVTELINCHLN